MFLHSPTEARREAEEGRSNHPRDLGPAAQEVASGGSRRATMLAVEKSQKTLGPQWLETGVLFSLSWGTKRARALFLMAGNGGDDAEVHHPPPSAAAEHTW
jgi:hypothetical protein